MAEHGIQLKKHISKEEIDRTIQKFVGNDFELAGKRYEILSEVIEYIKSTDDGVGITESVGLSASIWFPRVAEVLESAAFAGIAEILAIASAVVTPIGLFIELLNANYSGETLYGIRAVAYTTTAWAFNDPLPHGSPATMHRMRHHFSVMHKYGLDKHSIHSLSTYHKAWNDAKHATLINLDKIAKVDKEAGQKMWCALGGGNRQKLAARIIEGFAEEAKGVDKQWIEYGAELLYPH